MHDMAAIAAVAHEVRVSKRILRDTKITVEPDALVAEILVAVRDTLVNAYSEGYTTFLLAAFQHIFDARQGHFQSAARCEGLDRAATGPDAASIALRHACHRTAVLFLTTVLSAGVHARQVYVTTRPRSGVAPVSVVAIALALDAERAGGALLAREGILRQRLSTLMTKKADIHTHHTTFSATLMAMDDLSLPFPHDVVSLFVGTLPSEWHEYACGSIRGMETTMPPSMFISYVGVRRHALDGDIETRRWGARRHPGSLRVRHRRGGL
jgi:hypothetical protein